MIIRDISTPLSIMNNQTEHQQGNRRFKQRYQLDLTDIYRTLDPTMAENTFLSSACGTFSRTHDTLGHQTNLNKF